MYLYVCLYLCVGVCFQVQEGTGVIVHHTTHAPTFPTTVQPQLLEIHSSYTRQKYFG